MLTIKQLILWLIPLVLLVFVLSVIRFIHQKNEAINNSIEEKNIKKIQQLFTAFLLVLTVSIFCLSYSDKREFGSVKPYISQIKQEKKEKKEQLELADKKQAQKKAEKEKKEQDRKEKLEKKEQELADKKQELADKEKKEQIQLELDILQQFQVAKNDYDLHKDNPAEFTTDENWAKDTLELINQLTDPHKKKQMLEKLESYKKDLFKVE